MRTFETADEFETAVAEAMAAAPIDEDLRRRIAASVQDAELDYRRETAGSAGAGLNLRLGRFVMRDEDLPVVEAIGIATTAALALMTPGVLVAGAIVTAVSGFAALVWKGWRNGAMLTPDQIAVLGLVKLNGPVKAEELHRLGAARNPPLASETIDRALASLREVEMRDGDIVSFLREDGSGLIQAKAT